MPETVMVSSVDSVEKLRAKIEALFKQGKYAEITQAIGLHSILIDPQHTRGDQSDFYHIMLTLIKSRIRERHPKRYSSWLTSFPKLLSGLVEAGQLVTDKAAADVLASRHGAFGPFESVEEFFFWALDDRRLPLEQIVKYIDTTVAMHGK